ncbi:uncharacterized protein ACA1_012260 [Acanthamoeba castellanii str. Neff]|uniref:BLOC-1-related complex subunit 7 n=1 Tax=Acanthamoeba castellanii (strain ATCC 30010 / Neff) TaxID=1257118 RepID=L8HEI4_ACACF|nr:uncharacterized protein ACA1_012260 [Acanthamoeba castellanii str. Neff]ELR23178.1 hypothetical protein ACA1_012260 [Acanthamoeba castellanii str. Neff]
MDAADPSLATKEEETRRLENIIYDCGKAAKLLLDGSHQHEELVKTAKEFVAFERTILRTEDVLLGMERAMSELTEMTYSLQVSLEKLPLLARQFERLPIAEGEWLAQPTKIKF